LVSRHVAGGLAFTARGEDDLRTTADEIQENPPSGVNGETVQRLKRALSEATDAADDIEEEIE
jgi:hypothetical protein